MGCCNNLPSGGLSAEPLLAQLMRVERGPRALTWNQRPRDFVSN